MYNMLLLEVVGLTPTGKNFTVATAFMQTFMRNEQATTYRWVLQQIKHLYFSSAMSTENQQDLNAHEPKSIANIKSSLENSWTKEKFNAKNNPILRNISNKINHLALKKIWIEIKRATTIIDDPKNKCGHYMRTSHDLSCSCELITRFNHMLPIQLVDIEAFWRTLEIGGFHPSTHEKDMNMDSEMRSLTDLLYQISTGPISKVREMRRLVKGVLSSVLPEDPCMTLTSPLEVAITKGRKKTNSTKRDKLYWEHVSIAHKKKYKSQAVPVLVLALDLGRVRVLVRLPVGEEDRHELLGVGVEGVAMDGLNVIGDENYGYRVVANFVFGDEHQWPEVRSRMVFELEHTTNKYISLFRSRERAYELIRRTQWQNGPAPLDHWLETLDLLYIIANAFNMCMILIARLSSTTVLHSYSYSDRPGATNA
ncbi:hypothetical protein M9H77_13264 [Catharanthus roseus]|uniref:Uncharacterized protein n=1 Tax=Catharanthus roseus TaxID=4058 RepID=A0ACC0BJU1_CATRO|nr:hypothetical protein M9H77_13264 [Catharanthus roseus]